MITENDWRAIEEFVSRMVSKVGEPFVQGKVTKVDVARRVVFLKEFGDTPIPIVSFDHNHQWTDTRLSNHYICDIGRNTDWNFPASGGWTAVPFNYEYSDVHGMHGAGSPTIVIQEAGDYSIWGQIVFAASAAGLHRLISIAVNGKKVSAGGRAFSSGAAGWSTGWERMMVHADLTLAKGDAIEMHCYQDSGTDLLTMCNFSSGTEEGHRFRVRSESGSVTNIKKNFTTIKMPKKGDLVLVAQHYGTSRLPKCLGIIQGKKFVVTGD